MKTILWLVTRTILIRDKHHPENSTYYLDNTCFKTRIPTDLRSSLQYKNFDISHSFWGLMEAENTHLLVTVESVIFRLAVTTTRDGTGIHGHRVPSNWRPAVRIIVTTAVLVSSPEPSTRCSLLPLISIGMVIIIVLRRCNDSRFVLSAAASITIGFVINGSMDVILSGKLASF